MFPIVDNIGTFTASFRRNCRATNRPTCPLPPCGKPYNLGFLNVLTGLAASIITRVQWHRS